MYIHTQPHIHTCIHAGIRAYTSHSWSCDGGCAVLVWWHRIMWCRVVATPSRMLEVGRMLAQQHCPNVPVFLLFGWGVFMHAAWWWCRPLSTSRIFMCTCMYICIHVCMYVCMYVCMCIYVYICVCVFECAWVVLACVLETQSVNTHPWALIHVGGDPLQLASMNGACLCWTAIADASVNSPLHSKCVCTYICVRM